MLITAIERQKRNKTRFNIYIDGEFKVSLTDFDIMAAGLKVDKEISEEFFERVVKEAELNGCFNYLIDYIGKYLRTEKQIRDKLKEKNYSSEAIEKAIEKAKEYKYIDDNYVSEVYIGAKSKNYGKLKIKNELIKMGVKKTLAEEKVNEITEEGAVTNVAEKYLKGKREISFKEKQKLYRHLAARGFEYDEIKEGLGKLNLSYISEEKSEF